MSGGIKTASSGEANASNTYGEAKLASPKAKQLAFIKQTPATKVKSKASQPKGVVL